MENGSISIYFVQAALKPVIERGRDPAPLLRAAGIAAALLASPHSRVSAHSFSLLWLAVARALDDELFGQDGRRMKVGSFALLCHSLVHQGSLRDALLWMCRFFNLLLDDFHCSLESDARHAWLMIRQTAPAGAPRVLGFETLLMMQHGLACWLVGRRIAVLAAGFAYPRPPESAEYAAMYCTQLRFDQAATSLMFDRACLDLPLVQDRDTVKQFVRRAPENIVLKYKNSEGVAARIRRRLRALAHTDWPGFDACAASLNTTPSTLRRRLEDEGQSFQKIKDGLRHDIAIDALCHTSKSVAAIADELGFADASAFQRAFKKWSGSAPGQYRRACLPPRPPAPGARCQAPLP